MKNKYFKALIWILPFFLFFCLDERLIVKLLINLIPDTYIANDPSEFFPQKRDILAILIITFYLKIPKLIVCLFLSLLVSICARRFRTKTLILAYISGLTGLVLGWIMSEIGVFESNLTGPEPVSIGFWLVPVNMMLFSLTGFFLILAVTVTGFHSKQSLFYRSENKNTNTAKKEGIIYSLLTITFVSAYLIFIYPERRIEISSSVRTSQRRLEQIFKKAERTQDYKVLTALATNPKLSGVSLMKIYKSIPLDINENRERNVKILKSLAWNRSTPPQILTDISKHKLNYIFYDNLSRNPGTPGEVLLVLAKKKGLFDVIKKQVLNNPNLPADALILSADENEEVKESPPKILKQQFSEISEPAEIQLKTPKPGNGKPDISPSDSKTISIGNQTWMKEDIRVTRFNDSTAIKMVTDKKELSLLTMPAMCWYANDRAFSDTSRYGALYNWYAVKTEKLCPKGFHVPSDAEWTALTDSLGGEEIAGDKLKEQGTIHWEKPNSGAINESGFTALPGGHRYYNGYYFLNGRSGFWWTSSENNSQNAWCRQMDSNFSDVTRIGYFSKKNGLSVRCIRNK